MVKSPVVFAIVLVDTQYFATVSASNSVNKANSKLTFLMANRWLTGH